MVGTLLTRLSNLVRVLRYAVVVATWTVMAHVIIELSPWPTSAVSHAAAHFVAGGPHHLCVMPDGLQVVNRIAVGEILVFQVPCLNCEEPRGFLCGYEQILAASTEMWDLVFSDVIVF